MKTSFLCLALAFSFAATAQKIHFSDSTNSWKFFKPWDCTPPITFFYTTYSYGGDTTINSLRYLRLQTSGSTLGFIREDTSAGKVFIKNPRFSNSLYDTLEHLLFDYNLLLGDTLSFNYQNITSIQVKAVLYQIDSTMINGTWHRVQNFHQNASIYNNHTGAVGFSVIEGIGTTMYDPIAPIFAENECPAQLICFHTKGLMPAVPAVLFGNSRCVVGIKDISVASAQIDVVPNPISANSKVLFPKQIEKGTLRIYNTVGQCVYTQELYQQREISLTRFSQMPGIYLLTIRDEKENCKYYLKLIVN